jgi:hypothetical protein
MASHGECRTIRASTLPLASQRLNTHSCATNANNADKEFDEYVVFLTTDSLERIEPDHEDLR